MVKRIILMLVVMAASVAALAFFKCRQIQTAAQAASFQPPPEAVTTVVAKPERWAVTISVIGTVAAVQGVNVSADLPGIARSQIQFESGDAVREGDVLVRLDTKQEDAQLAAVEAERDLAGLNFARLKDLVNDGVISRAEYDKAAAEQKQTEAKVAEIRATIQRKTIRAPFSGTLGIRQVNLGQYLSGGNPVVPLQSLDPIYVNFGVPQEQAQQVQIGGSLRITGGSQGRVTAKESKVDETTRNMQIQATIANPRGTLRPGMFVQTELAMGASRSVIALPASSISYAPYGDSVFIEHMLTKPARPLPPGSAARLKDRAPDEDHPDERDDAENRAQQKIPAVNERVLQTDPDTFEVFEEAARG